MLVYGDRSHTIDPREALDEIAAESALLCHTPAGLARHARLSSTLIAAGGLAQGLADAAFTQRGGLDAHNPAADLCQAVTNELAGALVTSWRSGFTASMCLPDGALDRLRAALPSEPIEVRICEGYAYYGVYPELYAEAAAAMRPAPRVIGLRSIGTSLAAAAAAGCGSSQPMTLRPCGDPFARELRVAPALAAELVAPSLGGWAVVDEGPGLSGSSFAAVGKFLEANGVSAEAVTYLPSHEGAPGREASAEGRARWKTARKPRADFDDAIAPRLASWAEPLVGLPLAPLENLSGGLWRGRVPVKLRDAPAWPEQERRKFLLRTDAGTFLLKFAGLGAEGEVKLARARMLHSKGFATEPMGLAHGFLVERWIDGEPFDGTSATRKVALLDHLAGYLAFRSNRLEAPEPGASSDRLRVMMVRNLELAGLCPTADVAARLPASHPCHPMAIDGRLHEWEWRVGQHGCFVKTDALDHTQAHDLIGGQDLAWDIAGAAVEFTLSYDEAEYLRASLEREGGRPIDPRRVDFATLAYLAFQIGWWWMAAKGCGGAGAAAQCARYEDLARRWRPAA